MRDELLRRRLTAQLLAGPRPRGRDAPRQVTERLLAIQAQDPRGARLAIRARSDRGTAADVDRALDDGRLLITWLGRGTLHLVRAEDYRWLHALTTPQLRTTNATRLWQCGVSPAGAERAVTLLRGWLADDGPLGRAALRERLQRADVPVGGQALIHLLFRASLDGVLVRGPIRTRSEQLYVRVDDWLERGPDGPVDRQRALAELARRYLGGHGPASDRDLARWAGVTLGDARAGLSAIGPQLRGAGADGNVDLAKRPRIAPIPAPALLGPFDPVLLGWVSRDPIVGPFEPGIIAGGVFRPFALVDGRVAGVWRIGARSRSIELEPFAGPFRAGVGEALRADGDAVLRYLGLAP